MTKFLSIILLVVIILIVGSILVAFVVKKNKRKVHPQTEVKNTTNYNIAAKETGKSSEIENANTKEYLRDKKVNDGEPLTDQDFYNYKDKVE